MQPSQELFLVGRKSRLQAGRSR